MEVWEFLKDVFSVKLEELRMVQIETSGKRIHVKFADARRAEEVAGTGRCRLAYSDGTECDVLLVGPGPGSKVLRVRNLPMEVSTQEICLCLGQYGKILEVREERYPRGSCFEGLLSGTRVVKMVMKRDVPSYVRVGGHEAMVFYQGQKPTCHVCGDTEHFRANCPSRRRPLTWAERAQGRKGEEEDDSGPSVPPSPAASETVSRFGGSMPELRSDVTDLAEPTPPKQTTHAEEQRGVATPLLAAPAAQQPADGTLEEGVSAELTPTVTDDVSEAPTETHAVKMKNTLKGMIDEDGFSFAVPRRPPPAAENGLMNRFDNLNDLLDDEDPLAGFLTRNRFTGLRSRTASTASTEQSEDGASESADGGVDGPSGTKGRRLRGTAPSFDPFKSLKNDFPRISKEASQKRAAPRSPRPSKSKRHASSK